jgi:hypothetical protein
MGARPYVLEVRQHLNGPKKYCVPGREPVASRTRRTASRTTTSAFQNKIKSRCKMLI